MFLAQISKLIADALSQAPLPEITDMDRQLQKDSDAYVAHIIQRIPASPGKLQQIQKAQEQDNICQQLVQFCREGWPHHSKLKGTIKLYKSFANELSVQEGLLLRGSCIVIPPSLRKDIMQKLHTGHLGITKYQERAKQSVWWHIKSVFARHGIPETFVSDNGPQFSSSVFTQFANDYGFQLQTCSPNYP